MRGIFRYSLRKVSLKNLFVLCRAPRVLSNEINLHSHNPKPYTMNKLKSLLLAGSAFAFAGAASAQITSFVDQWTFDGASPQTGINGITVDTWDPALPDNSVPSPGLLRYATGGNATMGLFPSAIDVGSVDQLVLTIALDDLYVADGQQVIFQFSENGAANIELELNNNTGSNEFSLDMEGFGDTLSPATIYTLNPAGGNGALTITAVWDFDAGSMGYTVSGAATDSQSLAGLADASLTEISGFRIRGGTPGFTGFLTMDSITIETVAVPEPSTFALLAGFAGLGMVLYRRRR
jgi:hypothetical protein